MSTKLQPAGVSTGGQFAPDTKAEADVTLAPLAVPECGKCSTRGHDEADCPTVMPGDTIADPEPVPVGHPPVRDIMQMLEDSVAKAKAARAAAVTSTTRSARRR